MDLLPQSVNYRCYIEDGDINIFTASNGQENMASASISICMHCLEVKMDGYAIFFTITPNIGFDKSYRITLAKVRSLLSIAFTLANWNVTHQAALLICE